MPPPAHIGGGGNTKSGCDVCDSVRDKPRISGTAELNLAEAMETSNFVCM